MKAELVQNRSGFQRVLLTSETSEERRLLRDIGKHGELVVVVAGSVTEDGETQKYVSIATADELARERAEKGA